MLKQPSAWQAGGAPLAGGGLLALTLEPMFSGPAPLWAGGAPLAGGGVEALTLKPMLSSPAPGGRRARRSQMADFSPNPRTHAQQPGAWRAGGAPLAGGGVEALTLKAMVSSPALGGRGGVARRWWSRSPNPKTHVQQPGAWRAGGAPLAGGGVEALGAQRDQVVGVDGLQEHRHLLQPLLQQRAAARAASARTRLKSPSLVQCLLCNSIH